jgi:hypothetical protein
VLPKWGFDGGLGSSAHEALRDLVRREKMPNRTSNGSENSAAARSAGTG